MGSCDLELVRYSFRDKVTLGPVFEECNIGIIIKENILSQACEQHEQRWEKTRMAGCLLAISCPPLSGCKENSNSQKLKQEGKYSEVSGRWENCKDRSKERSLGSAMLISVSGPLSFSVHMFLRFPHFTLG